MTPRAKARWLGYVTALWLLSGTAFAAQMQDGQDFAVSTSTPTTGRTPWVLGGSSGAAPTTATSFIGIYAGSLTGTTTPPLGGLTNGFFPEAHLQVAKAAANSRTYFRGLGTTFTNGSAFLSFLLNVSLNPTTNDEIMGELIPAVASGNYPANPTANDPLTLHARQGSDTSHFNLGIQSLGGALSWLGTDLVTNTDYLVVLQYTFGSGQPCQLFVNPTPGAAQPAAQPAANASATKGAIAEPANIGTILFWESATATTGTYNYDTLRADSIWVNVTPSLGSQAPTNSPVMRVLFLGNSLLGIASDYSNNIPAILGNLASSLNTPYSWSRNAQGGWLLAQHATNVTSTNFIYSGNFDLVVLQEKSETPSLQIDRDTLMYPACRTLNGMITNHGASTMLYETWGQIDGDPNSNCNGYDIPALYRTCNYPSFASFSAMNIAIRKAYAELGAELGAAVSPAGLAWASARTERTNLNLYILDDSNGDRHPNSYGAYLTACVFYSAIFGRSPEGSTYYSTNNAADAQFLQRIAADTVLNDPFATDDYGFASNNYRWAFSWQNCPTPSGSPANTVVISGAAALPSPSVKVDTSAGNVGNVWLGTADVYANQPGQGRLFLYTNGSLNITNEMVVGKDGLGAVQQRGGNLKVNGTLTLAEQAGSTGQYTLSNGVLVARQILRGSGSATFSFQGGQLNFTQFGSVGQPLDLRNQRGIITLSNSVGTALVYGNFTNASPATLALQLSSTSNVLSVSGTAALNGSLNVNFAPGFQPSLGQQFTLLSAASLSGNFTNITLPAVGTNGLGLMTSITNNSLLATVINYAARLSTPAVSSNGVFQLSFSGAAGRRYVVQTSTNLLHWTPLVTNTVPFNFSTSNLNLDIRRFYRAVYLP